MRKTRSPRPRLIASCSKSLARAGAEDLQAHDVTRGTVDAIEEPLDDLVDERVLELPGQQPRRTGHGACHDEQYDEIIQPSNRAAR